MNTTEGERNSGHLQNPEVHYERQDMSARGVIAFLIGLAMAGVLVHVILWGLYAYLDRFQARNQPTLSPIVSAQPQQLPPQPRLQPDPVADMNKFRTAEEQVLHSYGWVDPKAGVVHIPIERAMQIIAQQGLPARGEQQVTPEVKPSAGRSTGRARRPSSSAKQ